MRPSPPPRIENSRAVIFQGPRRSYPRVYDPYYAKQARGTYRLLRIAHVSVAMPRPFIRTKRIYPRPNCRAVRAAAFPFSSTASVHGENARTIPCVDRAIVPCNAPRIPDFLPKSSIDRRRRFENFIQREYTDCKVFVGRESVRVLPRFEYERNGR